MDDTPSWAQTSSPDVPAWAGSSAPPAPKSSWSNLPSAVSGMFWSTVDNGTMMQPARYVAEHLDVGGIMPKLKAKYPGQSDEFYRQKLHDAYGGAVTDLRKQDQAAVDTHPYPGHLVGNTITGAVASVPANPELMFVPGASLEAGALKGGLRAAVPKVAQYAASNAARFGVANAASDAAAQMMDKAEGQQTGWDVDRSLQAAGMGAVLGAGHAAIHSVGASPVVQNAPIPDFVKNLFVARGVDTTPQPNPNGITSPLTGNQIRLSPEEQAQFKQVLKTGSVDDIKNFLRGKNGPQPSWSQVNQMVQMRDNFPENMVNGDNARQAFDEHIDDQHHQLVSDHIEAQTQGWKNKPQVEVINHVNDIEDPAVRQKAIDDGVTHENTVGFLGDDGKVRVFAPQVKSPEAVNAVLYHEALGHFGLQQQFGAGLDKVLDTLANRNVGGFGKEVDKWQKNNPEAYGGDRTRAAEEVLAERSQNGPLPKSWADAVVSHVRRFGRQMGLKLSYSDAEVNHILSMAHDAVINGKRGNVVANNFGHQQQEQKDRWLNFGESEPSAPEWAKEEPVAEQPPVEQQTEHPVEQQTNEPYVKSREEIDTDNEQVRKLLEAFKKPPPGDSKFMTPQQLNRSIADGTYEVEQMEHAYNATDVDYQPTHRSFDDVREEALRAGFSPSQIKAMGNGPDLSKRLFRIQAAAKVLDSRISGLLQKVDTPEWSVGHADALRQAIVDHAYILAKLRDERAETARALNMSKAGYTRSQMESYGEILRDGGGPTGPLGDDDTLLRFARTLKTVAGGHNPDGLNEAISALSKPNWEDYLTTLHQNMMLSGLSTHIKAPLDMMIGIGRDLLDNASALPLSAAREALQAIGIKVKPGVHPTEVAARLWGVLRAGLDAETYKNTASTFVNGGYNPNGFGGKMNARIPVISKVTDLISAQDAFFRAFSTNMHLYGLGTRQALEEARANGTPKDWDTIMTQGASYARQPSPELLKQAKTLADENLLLNKNAFTAPLDKLKRTTPDSSFLQRAGAFVANFLTPFVRVESNSLMTRVIRRSPLAFFDPKTIQDLKAGGIRGDVAMTRIVMGTAAIASYWAAAGKGKTTGDGPDNPAKKAVLEATGWRPNAVHENGQYNTGNKLGISLNPFDIHNATASMVADLREAYEKGANQGQVATGLKLAVLSSIKSLTDMSWVSDLAPAIGAFTAPNSSMESKVSQFLGDQASTMVPNLVGQATRVADQDQRMTQVPGSISQTVMNSVKSNIPGQRESLPTRNDPFGDPLQSGASMFGQHTWLPQENNRSVAGNHVDETHDPAKLEIGRLSQMYTENIISPVQRTITVNGEKMKLNNEQFSEYQRMAGHEILATLRDEMNSPEWSQMSDESKAEWIRDMQKDRKKAVRDYLYGEQ